MSTAIKPIRRVVTGNDANGKSRVLFDSAAPNVNPGAIRPGTCMTDVWVYETSPAPISGERDDGRLPFSFEPPHNGGHLRIVQSPPNRRITILRRTRRRSRCMSPGSGRAERGTAAARTRFPRPCTNRKRSITASCSKASACCCSIKGELVMKAGDVVVQLGNWHGWTNPREGSLMAFVMMGAKYEELTTHRTGKKWLKNLNRSAASSL